MDETLAEDGLAALILTGGASSRMGADKAQLRLGGSRAVDRVVALAGAVGAGAVWTVGRSGYGHAHISDATPGAGPVGGVIAGVAMVAAAGFSRLLVLAVDAPTILAQDLRPLLDTDGGAAYASLHLPFVAPVRSFPAEAEAGWPISRLVERMGLPRLECAPAVRARLRGANTPEEFEALVQASISPAARWPRPG